MRQMVCTLILVIGMPSTALPQLLEGWAGLPVSSRSLHGNFRLQAADVLPLGRGRFTIIWVRDDLCAFYRNFDIQQNLRGAPSSLGCGGWWARTMTRGPLRQPAFCTQPTRDPFRYIHFAAFDNWNDKWITLLRISQSCGQPTQVESTTLGQGQLPSAAWGGSPTLAFAGTPAAKGLAVWADGNQLVGRFFSAAGTTTGPSFTIRSSGGAHLSARMRYSAEPSGNF